MNAAILSGILLIGIGAFMSGSFAVPFGRITGWRWETYWMVFSLGAYIIFPILAGFIFVPDVFQIIFSTPSATFYTVFIAGAVYGIGNLSFGLALRYLGLSLGYALSLGLMLAIGTLIPPLIDGRLQVMILNTGGKLLLLGILTACVGIALSAWAGILKDKSVSDAKKKESIGEFNLYKGVMAAILVGITGSAMSLGFEQGTGISEMATLKGVNPLFAMIPLFIILYSGTFVTTILWCGYLGYKNNSLKNYVNSESPKRLILNYLFGFLAGFLWLGQFIIYGMGKSKMGSLSFTSWGILMALTIFFATVWGIIRKEWKGASAKVFVLMILSLLIIIISAFMIGISGTG